MEMDLGGLDSGILKKINGNARQGVAAATDPEAKAEDELVPHQLSNNKIVEQGAAFLAELTGNGENSSWAKWVLVIQALEIARSMAATAAGGKFKGARYNKTFRLWFELHPAYGRIDKSDRSRFHEVFEHLAEITAWRAALPEGERLRLNYPPTVLAHWKADQYEREEFGEESGEGSGKEAEPNLVKALVEIWKKMSDAEQTEALKRQLPDFTLQGLLGVMPPKHLIELN